MLKMMGWVFILFFLCLLGLTTAGQEYVQLLNLYDTAPEVLEAMSHSGHPVAVSVRDEDLHGVSSSVLKAESWLRFHVLAHFPATRITTIVVGDTLGCQNGKDNYLGVVLPSLKNLHYSITRWGLETNIKVSAAFSPACFDPHSSAFYKPLLEFLHSTNSSYSVKLPPKFPPSSSETVSLVSSHTDFIKKLGSFNLDKINVIVTHLQHPKPINRKLSSIDSETTKPYPARPIPLPETTQPPLHSPVGFSVPSNIVKRPLPPQANIVSPAPLTFPIDSPPPSDTPFSFPRPSPPPTGIFLSAPEQSPFPSPATAPLPPETPFSFPLPSPPPTGIFPSAPEKSPFPSPAAAPYGYSLPPCNPFPPTAAAAPKAVGVVQRLWCVAKPSVPAEKLQEAMNYACGQGGADCEEIRPKGSCFYPDTIVAHSSYAFNSYWQRTKRNGGTCSFGGTAMLINSDPSFLHCRFVLS